MRCVCSAWARAAGLRAPLCHRAVAEIEPGFNGGRVVDKVAGVAIEGQQPDAAAEVGAQLGQAGGQIPLNGAHHRQTATPAVGVEALQGVGQRRLRAAVHRQNGHRPASVKAGGDFREGALGPGQLALKHKADPLIVEQGPAQGGFAGAGNAGEKQGQPGLAAFQQRRQLGGGQHRRTVMQGVIGPGPLGRLGPGWK